LLGVLTKDGGFGSYWLLLPPHDLMPLRTIATGLNCPENDRIRDVKRNKNLLGLRRTSPPYC